MSVFSRYSEYYDLLYKDKDYQAEVDYVDLLIKKNNPAAKTILDLGCGTGIHAYLLAKKGYEVVGVDFSEDMILLANKQLKDNYIEKRDSLTFIIGDVRTVSIDQKFDVVLSLFHVFSYLNENDDITSALDVVKQHIKSNGTFLFDFWYGPGVLTNLPTVRVKRFENEKLSIVRIAEPELHANRNVADVNYSLTINDKASDIFYLLKEKHPMRYFFKPELDLFLKPLNMKITNFYEWRKLHLPTENSWTACVLVQL